MTWIVRNHPHIRTATTKDVNSLTELAERTFRDTYAQDNSAEDMEAYVGKSLSVEQIRAELEEEGSVFLLAFPDHTDKPSGYTKLRIGRGHANVTGVNPMQLQRLYADRSLIGKGVGAALMRAIIETAHNAGAEALWLAVWERNEHAIGFYKRWGFRVVGDHVFRLGEDEQTDLIMQRVLV